MDFRCRTLTYLRLRWHRRTNIETRTTLYILSFSTSRIQTPVPLDARKDISPSQTATAPTIPADTSAQQARGPQTQPLALPNQLLPPRHQPIYLIDKHEDPQAQRLALPNQPLNISLLRSDPVPLASRTAVVAEGSIMIPPAFVKDFPLRLHNAEISEGMVYNAAPLNEFSPDSYPRGPIPFPRIEGLPDPLRPTYAQNEHTETTPSDYWHNQVQSPRLDSMTNDEGLTAMRNIVLHVAANMYSKRGKGDAHDPGPQSPPNVYGSKTESYVIRRSPESVTKSAKRKKQHRNTPVVRRRGKLLKTDSRAMASIPEETTKIQLLPRHDAPTDTEATAPDGKIYVCPQPECEQHFHKDTTRALVVEYLMYDHHTEFSALKGETRCPFGWNKGFHDYDLLKLHIQKIECEMDEMVGSETFSDAGISR